MIFILVMLLNQGRSSQLRLGSMKVVSALEVPSDLAATTPPCTAAPACVILTRLSFSLLPSCGASTVIKSALQPAASARRTVSRVFSRSGFT